MTNFYLCFLVLLSFFFLLCKFILPAKKNLPPGPPSLPILGHLHLIRQPIHKTFDKIAKQYGPILYLQFGSRPILVVSSPSAVEDCFTKNDIVFANRPRLIMGKLLGQDYSTMLWAPYGPHWRNLRRISAVEILSASRVHTFSKMKTDEIKSTVKRLSRCGHGKEFGTVDMKSTFFELVLNITTSMIAGKKYYGDNAVASSDEAKRFHEIIKESFAGSNASIFADYLPFLRWIGKGFERRLVVLNDKIDNFVQELIEERRTLTKNVRDTSESKEEKTRTLVDVLLSLQENEPDHYTDEMIRGFMWIMIAAGTDTTAGTMEWVMSVLLNNQHVIEKAQAEIDAQVKYDRLVDESDLHNLPYLNAIICETLRMYPPGPLLIPHESSEDCVVGGFHVPRGTMLLVNIGAIQNDPKLWDDPTKFSPERFVGLQGTKDGYKFLPFGSGRRGCPGDRLGMHVMGLTLGALIQCFDWQRVGDEMVDMDEAHGITMHKLQPLEAKCRTRSNLLNLVLQF